VSASDSSAPTITVLGSSGDNGHEPARRDAQPTPKRRQLTTVRGVGDSMFRTTSWAAGLSVLAIMILVGGFLLWLSIPALRATGLAFLTTSEWQPDVHHFGIAAVLTFTILIALVALAVAVPLALGTALFISEVVPRPFKQTAISLVDLMAAVPSVVYGMWGRVILQDHAIGVSRFLATWFSWIPLFKVDGADPHNPLGSATVYTASTFIAGLVVALMVIPITCSIMREVFSQAPSGEREGAYALGATRWGMIRAVVLPFGKGGMIGAVMLGLGRALGETVAVYLIISPVFNINFHLLQSGSNSVSSLIVLRQGDASGFGRSALLAAGLALFVITLLVNFTASSIVARSRSGAQSEA
jgi:phosphate transport system permease protein